MVRRFAGVLAVLLGCAAFGAAGAGAATEIGSDCEASSFLLNEMATQSSRVTPPAALETAAPGVVTSWRVRTSTAFAGNQTLEVLKRVGNKYEVLAESAPAILAKGKNEFSTRIPVAAGTSFGTARTSEFIPVCGSAAAGDKVARFNTAPAVGGSAEPSITDSSSLLALMVVIEPDADGDGFGDETQDKCPQSAATQGACPAPPAGGGVGGATVKLKGKPKLEGNVVAVKLTASTTTQLTVAGTIRGKRAAKPVSKTVNAGETGRIYLALKKSVKQRLANLPRKRKLRMVVEVKATGSPTVSAEISLPGRKKPQPARAPR